MPYILYMFNFIETKLFTQLIQEYLSDGEYAELQKALLVNPEAGSVIPGSGGVRLLKSGGEHKGEENAVAIESSIS